MSDSVTNPKLYDKMEDIRLELKGDIQKVENKVDVALNEHISKLRDEITTLRIKYATLATKLGVLGFISASVTGAIVGAVVTKVIK